MEFRKWKNRTIFCISQYSVGLFVFFILVARPGRSPILFSFQHQQKKIQKYYFYFIFFYVSFLLNNVLSFSIIFNPLQKIKIFEVIFWGYCFFFCIFFWKKRQKPFFFLTLYFFRNDIWFGLEKEREKKKCYERLTESESIFGVGKRGAWGVSAGRLNSLSLLSPLKSRSKNQWITDQGLINLYGLIIMWPVCDQPRTGRYRRWDTCSTIGLVLLLPDTWVRCLLARRDSTLLITT